MSPHSRLDDRKVRVRCARRLGARRAGALLAEAMIAMTIAVMASSMILLAIETSVDRALTEQDRQMARDMADLIFAEMELVAWRDPSHTADEYPLKTEGNDAVVGSSRANFDDLGDFNGVAPARLLDRYGNIVGTSDYAGGSRPASMKALSGAATRLNFFVEVRYVSEYNFWDAVSSPTSVRHAQVVVTHRLAPYTEIDRFNRWFVRPLNN